ncbi:Uncharacterised protein [Klebsiella oxytoca]|nr:Uncharacterised protein [Klebsiella oxytoca]
MSPNTAGSEPRGSSVAEMNDTRKTVLSPYWGSASRSMRCCIQISIAGRECRCEGAAFLVARHAVALWQHVALLPSVPLGGFDRVAFRVVKLPYTPAARPCNIR